MNWAAVAAICSLVGLLVTALGAAFTYGSLTNKVKAQGETLKDHSVRLNEHTDKLGNHEVKLGRLQEWKDGFSAAVNVKGSHH